MTLQSLKETIEKLDREAEVYSDPSYIDSRLLGGLIEKYRTALPKLLRISEELQGKMDRLPADWFEDSSLETWFPITAETLKDTQSENVRLKAKLKVAEDALAELSDAVTRRLAYPNAKGSRLALWDAHKAATAALAEIRK